MRLYGFILTLAVLLLLAKNLFGAEPATITLAVYPYYCIEPCTVRYSAIVKKDEANRRWTISWVGTYEGSSDRPHQGTSAPYQIVGYIKDLPGGEYTVQTCVHRTDQTYCDNAKVTVISR